MNTAAVAALAQSPAIPWALLVASLALCALLGLRLARRARAQAENARKLHAITTAEQAAIRQLRLASHHLRLIGMGLQGNADHLLSGGGPDAHAIEAAANEVFDTADYMHEWTMQAQGARVLRDEQLNVGAAVDESVSAVILAIGLGRRQWNIQPELLTTVLRADRRALRHVLTRALTIAVRSSRQDDPITVGVSSGKDGVTLMIDGDNPRPIPADGTGNPAGNGAALRLTLAHSLMEAHGGRIDIEPGPRGGIRIGIVFPTDRLVRAGDPLPVTTVQPPSTQMNDRLVQAQVT